MAVTRTRRPAAMRASLLRRVRRIARTATAAPFSPHERHPHSRPQGSIVPREPAERPIDGGVRIGHVHLRTADIDRVKQFYVGVLGFDVVFEARDVPGWGTTGDILFVATGGYHHHLGFNTWLSKDGGPQPDGVAG